MPVIYHAARIEGLYGQPYEGSDRELLSTYLGGDVGFAYNYCPEGWVGSPKCYEIQLPDNHPVALDLSGDDLPRRDHYWSERRARAGKWVTTHFHSLFADKISDKDRTWTGIAAEMPHSEYELAFPSEGIVFGRPLSEVPEEELNV